MKQILIRPVITEKMTAISEKENKFGFIVDGGANKIEIRKAVEEQFGVKVVCVNTMNCDGKRKVRDTKTGIAAGRTKGYKKAVVHVAEGETIDFYEHI